MIVLHRTEDQKLSTSSHLIYVQVKPSIRIECGQQMEMISLQFRTIVLCHNRPRLDQPGLPPSCWSLQATKRSQHTSTSGLQPILMSGHISVWSVANPGHDLPWILCRLEPDRSTLTSVMSVKTWMKFIFVWCWSQVEFLEWTENWAAANRLSSTFLPNWTTGTVRQLDNYCSEMDINIRIKTGADTVD